MPKSGTKIRRPIIALLALPLAVALLITINIPSKFPLVAENLQSRSGVLDEKVQDGMLQQQISTNPFSVPSENERNQAPQITNETSEEANEKHDGRNNYNKTTTRQRRKKEQDTNGDLDVKQKRCVFENLPPGTFRYKEEESGETRWNYTGAIETTSKAYLGSKLELPLNGPPYYIVQHGVPRSGSTFQTQLLQAIIDLRHNTINNKNKKQKQKPARVFRNTPMSRSMIPKNGSRTDFVYQDKPLFKNIVDRGFVQKTHHSDWVEKTVCELHKLEKQVAVFVSVVGDDPSSKTKNNDDEDCFLRNVLSPLEANYDTGWIAHVQVKNGAEFRNCSSCEIETYYKPLFDLSRNEIEILRDFTAKYSIVRQCCGNQMSKYNLLRLHGCNISEYQNNDNYSYPWCENYDLPEIEQSFAILLKTHGLQKPEWTSGWQKPGDCAASEEKVRGGSDFNRHRWSGECTLDSVDPTTNFGKEK